jgi:hypothetical protein
MMLKWADFHLSAELLHLHYKQEIDGEEAEDIRKILYHATAILRFLLEDTPQTIIQIVFLMDNDSTNPTILVSISVGLLLSAYNAAKSCRLMNSNASGEADASVQSGKADASVQSSSQMKMKSSLQKKTIIV